MASANALSLMLRVFAVCVPSMFCRINPGKNEKMYIACPVRCLDARQPTRRNDCCSRPRCCSALTGQVTDPKELQSLRSKRLDSTHAITTKTMNTVGLFKTQCGRKE